MRTFLVVTDRKWGRAVAATFTKDKGFTGCTRITRSPIYSFKFEPNSVRLFILVDCLLRSSAR